MRPDATGVHSSNTTLQHWGYLCLKRELWRCHALRSVTTRRRTKTPDLETSRCSFCTGTHHTRHSIFSFVRLFRDASSRTKRNRCTRHSDGLRRVPATPPKVVAPPCYSHNSRWYGILLALPSTKGGVLLAAHTCVGVPAAASVVAHTCSPPLSPFHQDQKAIFLH